MITKASNISGDNTKSNHLVTAVATSAAVVVCLLVHHFHRQNLARARAARAREENMATSLPTVQAETGPLVAA